MVQAYDESSMVRVYVAQGQLQGEVIRTKLEAAGIPALLKYESVGVVMGIVFDGLGAVHVLVPAQFADEAIELLQATDIVDDSDFEDDPES
jgi:hypothetical protein